MTHRTQRAIRFAAVALLSAAQVSLLGCTKQDSEPAPPSPPPLTKQGLAPSSWKSRTPDLQDRLLLAHAIAKGKTEAMVMVATKVGSAPAVATAIAKLGGEIQTRFDEVGYLRVRLPLERLSDVSVMPDVLMAHLDGGGAGGSYSQDRDLVRYEISPASSPTITSATGTTDTLLSSRVARTAVADGAKVAASTSTDQPSASIADAIEALLRAATDPNIAVITHTPPGGRFPEGGQDVFALVANRAVESYGKPMFAPAGDGARVESINGAASGRRVLAIGAASVQASRGPASDGGAKPDLLALAQSDAGSVASTAEVARAAADLVAAARAEKLPSDARHISWALRMGARRLDNQQAHEQGFGVVDVARATELLRQLQSQQLDLPDILTRAPVKTYWSRFLPEPDVGQGLYEREDWLIKQSQTRAITLMRQNGPPTPLSYSLQWWGNDGSFEALQNEVTLPLNTPVEVEIEITPQRVGIHSAHLYLIDKTTELPVHAVMTTIVAAEQFTAANGYTIEHREPTLPAQRSERYFLEVPPNVSSLRVDVSVGAGQMDMLLGAGGPIGAGDAVFSLSPASKRVAAGKPVVVLVPAPPPGVYELTLLPFGSSLSAIKVSASIRYVDSLLDEEPPKNNATTLWLNNIYAPLRRSSVLTEVGARRVLDDVGGPIGMRAYNITVPADSTTLRVAASPPDGRTRMGLYLYDCVACTCQLWGSDVFTKPTEKFLVVPQPRAGVWRVVIDAGAAGTAFKYTEIITNPRFGSGTAAGEDTARRTGARWNQKVSFHLNAPVPFGYESVAIMDLLDLGTEAEERAAPYSDWQATNDARNQPLRPLRLTTQVFQLSPSP